MPSLPDITRSPNSHVPSWDRGVIPLRDSLFGGGGRVQKGGAVYASDTTPIGMDSG